MDNNKRNSLTRMVAVSVISSVWYHHGALSITQDQSSSESFEQMWKNRENQVLHDLNDLPVPLTVKNIFYDFYQPMGREIQAWMEDHKFLRLGNKIISEVLCWDNLGAIDTKRTTEKILVSAKTDKCYFRLACKHSFKDVILTMWPEVIRMWPEVNSVLQDSKTEPQVLFWVYYLQQSVETLMKALDYVGYKDTTHFALWLAISTNNKIAAEFFLAELPIEKMQRVVEITVKRLCENKCAYNYYMLPILMFHLDTHRQEELLCNYPQPILLQFLKWPHQNCFMEIANRTWNYLPARNYYRILDEIAHYMDIYDRSEVYRNIFKEFWCNAPLHCCEYVRNMCIDGTFLTRLSLLRHSKYIVLTLIQSFTPEQKERLITSYNGIQLFACLMKKQKWDIIQLVFDEGIPFKERTIWVDKLTETFSNAFEHNSMFTNMRSQEQDTLFKILNALREI